MNFFVSFLACFIFISPCLGADSEVLSVLKEQAKAGDAAAQYDLGVLYSSGRGIQKNPVEAFKLYEQAAKQGCDAAELRLGMLYSKGLGVEKNAVKAAYWLREAALQGNRRAQYKLGLILAKDKTIQDKPEALAWITLAAERGSHLSGIYQKKLKRKLSNKELQESETILLSLREQVI